MRKSLCSGILLATALGSGAVLATPIGTDTATSVIDVEFWGRRMITSSNPDDPTEDIISYGDPVHGKYEIWTLRAPDARLTTQFLTYDDAIQYGRTNPVGDQTPIQFVTSQWLSPLPPGFDGDVSPLPSSVAVDGSFANDRVTLGDDVQFGPDEPLKDWFQIDDRYTAQFSDQYSGSPNFRDNSLLISVTTPGTDIIQGLGLHQEFELDLQATGGTSFGRFMNVIETYVVSTYSFVVDRLHVSPRGVCTP